MSSRHRSLILGVAAALIHNSVFAQDPVNLLIEQGQYWQSRGNGLRATEAWQKLLRLNATQPDALYGMGLVELEAKRPEGARDYLARLRRASPDSPLAARLEQAINLSGNNAQLEDARRLARSGEPAQAVAAYQQVLGGKPPQGALALEYYQTLGGTPQGWDEARQGLERIARESPSDPQIALALGQHLTYRENTRRDGIQRLAALAANPTVGAAATDAWRRSLGWIGTNPSDMPLYEAFLRRNPDDAEIKSRIDEITKQEAATPPGDQVARESAPDGPQAAQPPVDPLRTRSSDGFKALAAGNLAKAETDFQAVLGQRRNDGDALGGLGIVRLRQERFADSRDLLERATRQGSAARWRTALNSATYWSLVGQAIAARGRTDLDTARRLLEQAVRLDSKDITAENALADVLTQRGELDAAEAAYRRVLGRQAGNPDAVRGLVGVLARNDKPDDALAVIEGLSPAQQGQIAELGKLRAVQAAGAARSAAARGDDNSARTALERAISNDPHNPWTRLDLARLYLKVGNTADARGVMDALLATHPDMPEAAYASALLASEMGDWNGAVARLEHVPIQLRTRDMGALQRRVWVRAQADRASALARQGDSREALATLKEAEGAAGEDAELLGVIASAYDDAGEPDRAVALLRQTMARTASPGNGMRLQYAALLLKTGQDAELAGVLGQLQPDRMTRLDRQSFEGIRLAHIVRQADRQRESGALEAAYETLEPLLAERPDDPQVVGALARMYTAAGEHAQALKLYTALLRRSPDDVPLLLSAANAAAAAGQYDLAASTIENAIARAPHDAEVLTAAGRLYRAQGKYRKAEQYFTAALAAEGRRDLLAAGADRTAQKAPAEPASQAPTYIGPYFAGGNALSSIDTAGQTASPFAGVSGRIAAPAEPRTVRDELSDLRQERTATIAVAPTVRRRQGEAGLGELRDRSAPVEMKLPMGDGRFAVRVTPVAIDAGTAPGDFATNSRFGGGPVAALAQANRTVGGPGSQREKGTAVGLGYLSDRVEADIGSSPLGFRYATFNGGVRVKGPFAGDFSYDADVSRRPVTESLLSFAGARDARTGASWGGVSATGARVQIGYDKGGYGLYGYGSYHALDGTNVMSNSRIEGGGGAYARLMRDADSELTAGINIMGLSYDRNLRYFTYGHGGYFSPQSFVSMSVPLTWNQRSGRLAYQVRGSLGVQHFTEDAADYFAGNAGRQAAAQAAAVTAAGLNLGGGGSAVYAAQTKTGLGYSLAAAAEYQVSPQLFLGGQISTDNASEYRQVVGGVYLKFTFEPITRRPALPVNPVRSPFQ
jgi:tetratricopeptide (TPR) repeat protein